MSYKQGKQFLDECKYLGFRTLAEVAAFAKSKRQGLREAVREEYLKELLRVVSKVCL